MEKLNLKEIPDGVRWKIANGMRSAADKWVEFADGPAKGSGIESVFRAQAADAIAIAEQMEDF